MVRPREGIILKKVYSKAVKLFQGSAPRTSDNTHSGTYWF